MRISDWSSDVCSSDLIGIPEHFQEFGRGLDHRFDGTGRAGPPASGLHRALVRIVHRGHGAVRGHPPVRARRHAGRGEPVPRAGHGGGGIATWTNHFVSVEIERELCWGGGYVDSWR